jgi:signal transduction histidine kinase
VKDSGLGSAGQDAERLFEAFYITKPAGMGIGLSICHAIDEAHGLPDMATSNEGPCASAEFTLPTGR